MRKLFFVNFQNTPLFFLLCFVQRLGNLLRDALPIFLVFCPRISFQRGIPQVRCLTGPRIPFLNQTNVIDQSGGFQRFDQ